MPGTVQHVEGCVSRVPVPLAILNKLGGEEQWLLWPRPGVPVSHVGIVVYEGGMIPATVRRSGEL